MIMSLLCFLTQSKLLDLSQLWLTCKSTYSCFPFLIFKAIKGLWTSVGSALRAAQSCAIWCIWQQGQCVTRAGSPTAHPSSSLDTSVASFCPTEGRGDSSRWGLGALLQLCSQLGSELPSPSSVASHLWIWAPCRKWPLRSRS